jgi:hypothetical protein
VIVADGSDQWQHTHTLDVFDQCCYQECRGWWKEKNAVSSKVFSPSEEKEEEKHFDEILQLRE